MTINMTTDKHLAAANAARDNITATRRVIETEIARRGFASVMAWAAYHAALRWLDACEAQHVLAIAIDMERAHGPSEARPI
jgi:hypothetical protein